MTTYLMYTQSKARQPLHEPLPSALAKQGRGEVHRAQVVNCADDLVILSRGYAEEALVWTRQVMTQLGPFKSLPGAPVLDRVRLILR